MKTVLQVLVQLSDGLYRVTTGSFCAGFTVRQGHIDKCAPILKKKLDYWINQGELIMTFDPFADEAQAQTNDFPPTTEVSNNMQNPAPQSGDGNKVSVTLKGGTGYEAPWVVVYGTDIPDALTQMKSYENELKELIDRTAKVGSYFARSGHSAPRGSTQQNNGGGQAQQQTSTPPQQQAPSSVSDDKKTCKHGDRIFKSGFNQQKQKEWKALFCPVQNKAEQCEAVFF